MNCEKTSLRRAPGQHLLPLAREYQSLYYEYTLSLFGSASDTRGFWDADQAHSFKTAVRALVESHLC
jgi:hypothetical protein